PARPTAKAASRATSAAPATAARPTVEASSARRSRAAAQGNSRIPAPTATAAIRARSASTATAHHPPPSSQYLKHHPSRAAERGARCGDHRFLITGGLRARRVGEAFFHEAVARGELDVEAGGDEA